MPAHNDANYIWSAVRTRTYEYDSTGGTWNYTDALSGITCTSGLDAFANANAAQETANAKSTTYYTDTAPTGDTLKVGDIWVNSGYTEHLPKPTTKNGYIGFYVDVDNVKTQVTADNYETLDITAGSTSCYTHGEMQQCVYVNPTTHVGTWTDIGGELVLSKLTSSYISALDITANKITVEDSSHHVLFKADADANSDTNKVSIGGFTVTDSSLYTNSLDSLSDTTDTGVYIGNDGLLLRENGEQAGEVNEVKIDDGKLYANNADISGTINASGGHIGGFTIDTDRLYSTDPSTGDINIELSGSAIKLGDTIKLSDGAMQLGNVNNSYGVRIDSDNAGSGRFIVNKDLTIKLRDTDASGFWFNRTNSMLWSVGSQIS